MKKTPNQEKRTASRKCKRRRTPRKKINNKEYAKTPRDRNFRERIYKNGKITERYLTREEVKVLNPDDVDFHWDLAHAKAFIRTQNGKRIRLYGDRSRFGWITEPLLRAKMYAAGQSLTLGDLVAITKLVSLESSSRVSARKTKLRRIFGEVHKPSWFFIATKDPYAVGWSEDRSWRIIEFVANAGRDGSQTKDVHDAGGGTQG